MQRDFKGSEILREVRSQSVVRNTVASVLLSSLDVPLLQRNNIWDKEFSPI